MTTPPTSTAERESVRRICGRLQQAYRGLGLYPSDHPTTRHTLSALFEVLEPHLEHYGPIMLRITEDAMLFDDEEVYSHEETRGSLAFLMFRDGVRFLSIHPGLDESESEAFIDCLAHADDLAAMEYDLPTALWERDLPHIEYEVVDPFLGTGGEQLRDQALNDLRDTVLRRLGELSPGTGVGMGSGTGTGGEAAAQDSGEPLEVAGEDLSPERAALTQADLDWSESAVEGLKNILEDFAVVLLEIAGTHAGDPKADATLARSLSLVVERYLDDLNVGNLDLMVNQVASLVSDGRRPPEFGVQVFSDVTTTTRLARVISLMGQSPPDLAARIGTLLGKIYDWVLPTLLEMLVESSDKAVRRIALELLDKGDGVPLAYLWPLMADPRWYVVRNAVALATRSGDPSLAEHLEPLVNHPDARVRREVIRSLDKIGSQRSATLLARALTDTDLSVRVLAAHAVRRHGNSGHLGALQAHVEARDFPTRPAEEIAAFLVAYAVLGGQASVEMLDKLWRRRLFGTRPLGLRLGAIEALGFVGSASAQDALKQAAKSSETQIQRAAAKALADGHARTRGEVS